MRVIISAFLFLSACTAGSSSSPNGSYPYIRNAKPGAGTIAVVGDSLANGFGAKDVHNTPAQCLFNAYNNRVSNFAFEGATSADTLSRVAAVDDVQPRLVFVSAGGNDVLEDSSRPGTYPVQKSLDEMDRTFDQLLATGAVVAYLGLTPPYAGTERLQRISEMARSKGVIVVDGMSGMWGKKEFMSDAIHPNDRGYQILCTRLREAVGAYYP